MYISVTAEGPPILSNRSLSSRVWVNETSSMATPSLESSRMTW